MDFEKSSWLAGARGGELDGVRLRMAESVMNQRLQGKSKEEVVQILGKPDGGEDANSFAYYLGKSGVFQMGSEWLRLFLERGIVARIDIRGD